MTNWIHMNSIDISARHIKLNAEGIRHHVGFLREPLEPGELDEAEAAIVEALKIIRAIKKPRKTLKAA